MKIQIGKTSRIQNINSEPISDEHGSESSGSDICIPRRKKRKRNPFIDDEADIDGSCSGDENDDDMDDMQSFIDDSEVIKENDFHMTKRIEVELNRENLLKFLAGQTKSALAQIGLDFVYSHPQDIFKQRGKSFLEKIFKPWVTALLRIKTITVRDWKRKYIIYKKKICGHMIISFVNFGLSNHLKLSITNKSFKMKTPKHLKTLLLSNHFCLTMLMF